MSGLGARLGKINRDKKSNYSTHQGGWEITSSSMHALCHLPYTSHREDNKIWGAISLASDNGIVETALKKGKRALTSQNQPP